MEEVVYAKALRVFTLAIFGSNPGSLKRTVG